MIEKSIIDKIIYTANLKEVAQDFMQLQKSGKDLQGKCPNCGADGKGRGMIISDNKNIFKCFHCDTGGKGVVSFLMTTQGMEYMQSIRYLGDKYTIDYNAEQRELLKKQHSLQQKTGKGKKDFTDLQLESSGLTAKDVLARVHKDEDDSKTYDVCPYQRGTLNEYYKLLPGMGNDMVIYYYGLDGLPVTYQPKKSNKTENFFRIRFQNPDARRDKSGRPIKYYSPAGSGTHIYIPQQVRHKYQNGMQIDTLYIQEGEKKADKACKHGLLSIGVMGIHNIGSGNIMPGDLEMLIQRCNVKRTVFVLDGDWQEISRNIKNGDNPQQRSLSFFFAIKNYKEYMISFRNLGINLEVYFAAIKPNEKNLKGIDDLLHGLLQNKEDEFVADLQKALNSKDGRGTYIDTFKITTLTDFQIKDYWRLNSAKEFAEHHKELLRMIPEFRINKTLYRFSESGVFELAEPILPEEKFWEHTEKGGVEFRYKRSMNFLRNRGYGRLSLGGKWELVHFKNHIVQVVDRIDIKTFVLDVAEQIASEAVQELMLKGGSYYLGPDKLENLKAMDLKFELPGKTFQNMHFRNSVLKITENNIEVIDSKQRLETIWVDQIIDFNVELLKAPMIDFEPVPPAVLQHLKTEDNIMLYRQGKRPVYSIILNPEAQQAHFLQFLINSSNFNHTRYKTVDEMLMGAEPDYDAYIDTSMHLLAKLTALGYLSHKFHNAAVAKAVIGVDGKLSEVGASNGRTGKSLFGKALSKIMPQVYIGGKTRNLTDDQFLFEEVNEKTQNVFFDDVRTNLDFEYFFPNITGQWKINAKGVGRYTLPDGHPIKLYFSTNHMINGEGTSFTDRMHHIVFSDYYNDEYKPVDEFGTLFFDEWGQEQWNYFYNLIALSLQLYFRFGLVEAPTRQIEKRRLRQMMGEEFLTWAEEYFSAQTDSFNPSSFEVSPMENLGERIARSKMYDSFKSRLRGRVIDYYTATRFGRCIRYFCEYKEYHFNPHKPNKNGININDFIAAGGKSFIGSEDKSAGVEYFTVSKN